jgi:hypothetical protein
MFVNELALETETVRSRKQAPCGFEAGDANLRRYVGNDPANATDPTGLYQEDVHFYMTYYIALAIGLGDYQSLYTRDNRQVSEAYVIAWADQFTDVHTRTEPIRLGETARLSVMIGLAEETRGPFGFIDGVQMVLSAEARKRQAYHFPLDPGETSVSAGSKAATKRLNAGIKMNDLMRTGIGLHTYQDSWSHEGFEPYLGHWSHDPDYAWLRMDKAMSMAEATYDKLAEYMQKAHGKAPLKKWKDIEATVKKLLQEHNPNDSEDHDWRDAYWRQAIIHDFDPLRMSFESDGDADVWAPWFLQAADLTP